MAGCKCYILEEMKPIMGMVCCQILSASAAILYKLAFADGMKVKLMVLYRLAFATAFITPIALISERNERPKMTWRIFFQGFLGGMLGAALTSNLFGESLRLTTATFAAAMTNLIPAATFIMAVMFRLERLNVRTSAGKAKILGTLMSISGAMVLTFYKGLKLTNSITHTHLVHHLGGARPKNQVLGTVLALLSCLSYASWLIVQTNIRYPRYSSIALMCFMGSIQTGIYALCTERTDWSSWKLAWNIGLFTTGYSGIVSSGITTAMAASCTMIKGPLFAASFTPLGPLFIAMLGSLFLDEMFHLGSFWGKVKERKEDHALLALESKNEPIGYGMSVDIQAIANPNFNVQNSDNRINEKSSENPVEYLNS